MPKGRTVIQRLEDAAILDDRPIAYGFRFRCRWRRVPPSRPSLLRPPRRPARPARPRRGVPPVPGRYWTRAARSRCAGSGARARNRRPGAVRPMSNCPSPPKTTWMGAANYPYVRHWMERFHCLGAPWWRPPRDWLPCARVRPRGFVRRRAFGPARLRPAPAGPAGWPAHPVTGASVPAGPPLRTEAAGAQVRRARRRRRPGSPAA